MNNKKPKLIAAVFVFFGAVAAIGFEQKSAHKNADPPRTVTVSRGDLVVKVSETGTIEPQGEIDVKSKVAGRLLSVPIEEGDYVSKGQLIAVVDQSLIQPQIASTRAQLADGEAHLQQTIAQYNLSVQQDQMAIEQAQASLLSSETHLNVVRATARPQELAQDREAVDRAQITLDDATRNAKRKAQLLQSGFIPQSDYDTAQVAVDTAASNLQSAQQALSLAVAGPRLEDVDDAAAGVNAARVNLAASKVNAEETLVRKYDIDQARATVQQTDNDLDQLLVNLNDTTIVAPSAGTVLKKYKSENEIVQSATTGFSDSEALIVTLGSNVYVSVDINEVDIAKVHLGAPVTIQADALPDATFNGVVTSIAPAATNVFSSSGDTGAGQSGIPKFAVAIAFKNVSPQLRPGMTANVDIICVKHPGALLLPLEGLGFDGASGAVEVLVGADKQINRDITVGLKNDTDAEILTGLSAGDRVVVPGLDQKRRTIDFSDDDDD